jgi:coenzyme PQQ synthesis protein D (PqqD)
VSCDLSGSAAILNLSSGMYYGLEGVGGRIWTLLQQPIAVQSLLDRLLSEYEADARCEDDLFELLRQLADEGLIDIRDE